jgi:hypothetical protein
MCAAHQAVRFAPIMSVSLEPSNVSSSFGTSALVPSHAS